MTTKYSPEIFILKNIDPLMKVPDEAPPQDTQQELNHQQKARIRDDPSLDKSYCIMEFLHQRRHYDGG
jgi:hypothetical protein